MRSLFWAMAAMLAIAPSAIATELEGTVSLFGTPLGQPYAGLSAEARWREAGLDLVGAGATNFTTPSRYWSAAARWTPLREGPHSLGILAGYAFANTGDRFGAGALDDVLLGLVYQWKEGPWWMRFSPYGGWNIHGTTFSPIAMIPGSVAGPVLFEVGWRPIPHLEFALRTSLAPLRVGFVW